MHSRTTAREIIDDFANERLDYFVTGFGTGGTLKGVARALKQRAPRRKIIAAEPDNSPVLGSGIPQPRDAAGNPAGSHPRFRPHLMQGWSPDFISKLTEEAVAAGLHRRDRAGRRRRRAALLARARAQGRHLRRHLERRDAGRGADDRAPRAGRREHRLHAARHRRALHVDAAVRRHRRRDDGRGVGGVAFDAAVPLRCARAARRRPRRAGAPEPRVAVDPAAANASSRSSSTRSRW